MTYAQFLEAVQKRAEDKGITKDDVVWAHLHVEGKGVIHIGLLTKKPTRRRN